MGVRLTRFVFTFGQIIGLVKGLFIYLYLQRTPSFYISSLGLRGFSACNFHFKGDLFDSELLVL